MIDKTALTEFVEQQLEDTDLFLVEVKVTPDNVITVEVDSDSPVDIDECIALSRKIEEAFDRE
ncbi:MAG: ribosome assembly cofactor RimP, partial [Muribaculaceae bacterium]|nr:ribosome assembly cofactor RimP [Muribaculaceae bacterium]